MCLHVLWCKPQCEIYIVLDPELVPATVVFHKMLDSVRHSKDTN
jgi:hypothetical protein